MVTQQTEEPIFWHTMPIDAACARLKAPPSGLTAAEAARRLDEYGPNELEAARRISPWALLFAQFKNLLIVILLIATVLSAFLGHGVEAVSIAIIVLLAVVLGFLQEYRAERAIEALRRMAAPTASVLRNGEEIELPARDLVPGDVVLLRAGNKIPADARLIEAVNLSIEEAALTGESVPVRKHTAPLPASVSSLGDQLNMAFAGTTATYGRGRALIVATGMGSEFGKIARMLQTVDTGETPLQENLARVGRALALGALAVVAVIVALGLLRGQPFIEMLVFGIALAVAVVPEALPAVVTISLAMGVQRMVKRNALMRRLPAVETLGSVSVICTDKTGTLTKDEMTVRKVFVGGQMLEVSGVGYEPQGAFSRDGVIVDPGERLILFLEAAVLASDAYIVRDESTAQWRVKGDPTEGALVVAAAKARVSKSGLDARYPRVNEIPFTSETKRMTTLHRAPESIVACSKGAPEIILGTCARLMTNEGIVKLDPGSRDAIVAAARAMAGEALRVLGVATRSEATPENAETDMVFLGLAGMIDPPRPEAVEAIRTCGLAGIRPVMITGDHPLTAQAVARELGLLKNGRFVTGDALESMSEEELTRDVDTIELYARVSPAHKLRVVTALQKKGHVVAMTGDGVNDAPALKKADIGIAMGVTGTDVAKEAAAMTLTDDNFASIVAAVEEGRAIFDNIKKYLMYLLSSNIGEMLLMAAATFIGLPLPLSAVQLLYVNLVTDGLPALALAMDPHAPDLMRRTPRDPRGGIFTRPVVTLMMVGGVWSALVNLGLFIWAMESGRSAAESMTMTFVLLILIQFFKAYNFRSDRNSVLNRTFANKYLNMSILLELAMLAAVIYVPFLHGPFGTFSLSALDCAIIVFLAFTVSPVLELAKWMERRGWFGKIG